MGTRRTEKKRIRESAGLGNLSNSSNSNSNSNSNGIVGRNGPVILKEDYFNLTTREEFRKMNQTKKNKRNGRVKIPPFITPIKPSNPSQKASNPSQKASNSPSP